MATQWPHLRVIFGGTFFTDEQWQVGLHMAFREPSTHTDAGMISDAANAVSVIDSAIVSWLAGANCCVHTEARYGWLKVNAVKDGKYIDTGHTNLLTKATPVAPTSYSGAAPTSLPPQMALCLSTKTSSRSRGPGSHGRVFLPAAHLPFQGSGPRIQTSSLVAVRDAWKAFLNDLNSWPSPWVTAEAPYVAHCPAGTTLALPVESVSVGDCWDVQRSRSKQLREVYSTATLA